MELFLISDNIKLINEKGQLYIEQALNKTPVNASNLHRIWAHDEVNFSGKILTLLLQQSVEVIIQNDDGLPLGYLSPWKNPKGAKARQAQPLFALSTVSQHWMANWLLCKHERQLAWLKEYNDVHPIRHHLWEQFQYLVEGLQQKDRSQLMPEDIQEAYLSRIYLQIIKSILPAAFKFEKRSRQPAQDQFNALLNYAYGIFYGIVGGSLQRIGLDIYIGFLHKERDGDPALVFDVIEAYRPWADEVCFYLCKDGVLDPDQDFRPVKGGVWLAPSGKTKLVSALMDYLEVVPPQSKNQRTRKSNIFTDAKELKLLIANWEPPIINQIIDKGIL